MPNLNELKASLATISQENATLAREQKELDGRIGGLSREIESASKNEQQARSRAIPMYEELRQIAEKLRILNSSAEDSKNKIDKLKSELVECYKKMEKTKHNTPEFKKLEKQFKKIKDNLDAERIRNAQIQNQISRMHPGNVAAFNKSEDIRNEVLKFEQQNHQLVSKKHKLEQSQQEISRQLEKNRDKTRQIEQQILTIVDEMSAGKAVSFSAAGSQPFFKPQKKAAVDQKIEDTYKLMVDTIKAMPGIVCFVNKIPQACGIAAMITIGEVLTTALEAETIGEKQEVLSKYIMLAEAILGNKMSKIEKATMGTYSLLKDRIIFLVKMFKQHINHEAENTNAYVP